MWRTSAIFLCSNILKMDFHLYDGNTETVAPAASLISIKIKNFVAAVREFHKTDASPRLAGKDLNVETMWTSTWTPFCEGLHLTGGNCTYFFWQQDRSRVIKSLQNCASFALRKLVQYQTSPFSFKCFLCDGFNCCDIVLQEAFHGPLLHELSPVIARYNDKAGPWIWRTFPASRPELGILHAVLCVWQALGAQCSTCTPHWRVVLLLSKSGLRMIWFEVDVKIGPRFHTKSRMQTCPSSWQDWQPNWSPSYPDLPKSSWRRKI